jgi:uncharacterized protein YndB with AHSA1/START domain
MLPDQVLSIDISVPIDRVWHELTKTGAIQRAMNNTVLEGSLTPGSKLRWYSPSKQRVFVVGEVVEVSPPKKFSHTWKFTMSPDAPTLVTWELAAIPGGCRVTMTHSRWAEDAKMYKSVATTWAEILRLLKLDLESGDIPFGTKAKYWMFSAMEFALPKTTSVEEVTRAGW